MYINVDILGYDIPTFFCCSPTFLCIISAGDSALAIRRELRSMEILSSWSRSSFSYEKIEKIENNWSNGTVSSIRTHIRLSHR